MLISTVLISTVGKPVAGFIRGIWHFSWIVARYNKDGLLRGRQMSGARPIKMPYTTDQVLFWEFSDGTK
jgi:hypothetical protein